MESLFREMSKKIKIYLAIESETDPTEHTTELTLLPPIPISAVINDLGFGKVIWQMTGIITSKAKELYIELKNKSLIEQSYKIEIDGEYYEGFKVNSKLQTKQEGSYLRVYVYIKQV